MKNSPPTISNKQTGWTLIELVIAMGIIAILGSYLFIHFYDADSETRATAVNNVAASLNVVSAANYRYAKAGSSKATTVDNCTDVASLLTGGLPSGYQIAAQAITAGTRVTCTVSDTSDGSSATFTGMGTS